MAPASKVGKGMVTGNGKAKPFPLNIIERERPKEIQWRYQRNRRQARVGRRPQRGALLPL